MIEEQTHLNQVEAIGNIINRSDILNSEDESNTLILENSSDYYLVITGFGGMVYMFIVPKDYDYSGDIMNKSVPGSIWHSYLANSSGLRIANIATRFVLNDMSPFIKIETSESFDQNKLKINSEELKISTSEESADIENKPATPAVKNEIYRNAIYENMPIAITSDDIISIDINPKIDNNYIKSYSSSESFVIGSATNEFQSTSINPKIIKEIVFESGNTYGYSEDTLDIGDKVINPINSRLFIVTSFETDKQRSDYKRIKYQLSII